MARLLIAAMVSSGHRARLVRWVMEAQLMSQAEVTLSGPKSLLEHKELVALRGRFIAQEIPIDEATVIALARSSWIDLVRKQSIFRSLYSQAVRQTRLGGALDLVILPAADDALDAWAVLGTGFAPTPWVGISMRPAFHLANMKGMVAPARRDDWVRNKLYRKLLRDRSLHKLLTIDPTMREFASSSFTQQENDRLGYLPDPSLEYDLPARAASRAELGIPGQAHLVLLYGSLTARKGVSQLIRAASDPLCPVGIHVLLAGVQNTEIKQLLQQKEAKALSAHGRLHVLEQYLDDHLERTVLSAADSMWLGYSKFYGMSGVLVLAVRHGLPCIFTREGTIGYLGRKFAVGPEMDPDNLPTAVEALRSVIMQPQQWSQSLAEARRQFAIHSIEHFRCVISEATRNAIPS